MHKLFKPRTIRRILLLLALAFPMVYLMGTAFFALNGSHGNVLLDQEEDVVTSSQIVDFNQQLNLPDVSERTTSGVTYSVTNGILYASGTGTGENGVDYSNLYVNSNIFFGSHVYYFRLNTYGTNNFTGESGYSTYPYLVVASPYGEIRSSGLWTCAYPYYFYFRIGTASGAVYSNNFQCSVNVFDLTQMYGAGNEPTDMTFFDQYYDEFYYPYTSSYKVVEQTTEAPTYSEYLFNQVFGHDNIVTQLGYYALSEEQKGFAPLSSLIRFVDDNILHWGDGNALAVFSYGYVYYAMSTLIVYEFVIIAIKLLLLPLKAVDVFDRKGEYDD